MHPRQKINIRNEDGFALISIALLLIVTGLALSTYIYAFKTQREDALRDRTDFAFSTVLNKMVSQLAIDGHFPCPASRNLPPTDPLYGVETDCTDTSVPAGTCSATDPYCVAETTPGGPRIRIGIIPFRTLGIDRNDAIDAYGNFLTYALTETQGTGTITVDNGNIQLTELNYDYIDQSRFIINPSNPGLQTSTANNLDFVLISHGPDGRGSYTLNGTPHPTPCTGSHDDIENCDNDANFLKKPLFNAENTDHFDDKVEAEMQSWIYIWSEVSTEPEWSTNRGNAKIGVGTSSPTHDLHVAGNLRIEEDSAGGILYTDELCDETHANCFDPTALGGDFDDGNGMECPANTQMVDIVNGAPICKHIGKSSGSCPAGYYFTGISYTAGSTLRATCTNLISGATTNITLH